MHLLSVVATWGINAGGVERHIRSIDSIAAALGHEHRVIAAWARDSWAGDVEVCSNEEPPEDWTGQLISSASLLRKAVRSSTADVVVAHGLGAVVAAQQSRKRAIAINYYPGGLERRLNWDLGRGRHPADRVKEVLLDTFERWSLSRLRRVVVLSHHGRALLSGRLPRLDPVVIPPHLNTDLVCTSSSDRTIDIVVARRLSPRMGHEKVFRQLATLIRDRELTVVIAGTGPLHDRIRHLVSQELGLDNRIRLVGAVADSELRQLYAQARFALVPASGGEGFGLAALEALAAGVLPVVSDLPTLREIVEPVSADLIAANGDWDTCLQSNLDKPADDLLRLRQSALRRARQFSLAEVAPRWEQVLAGVTARSGYSQ